MSKQMRKYNSDFKLKVVLKYLTGNSTISQLCQEFEISKATLNNWNKGFNAHIVQTDPSNFFSLVFIPHPAKTFFPYSLNSPFGET